MGLTRYLLGTVLLVAGLGPVTFAAWSLRRWVLPAWSGAPARLAEVVVALGLMLGTAELLGAVGQMRRTSVIACWAIVGTAVGALALRRSAAPRGSGSRPSPPVGLRTGAFCWAVVAFAVAQWTTWVAGAYAFGISADDSIHFHLTNAARYLQQGWITPLHLTAPGQIAQYQPANAELVHTLFMLPWHRDVLSPLLNLGWMALALLAAWCVGRRKGLGPVTLTAAAVVLVSPIFVTSEAGTASTDVAGVFFLLASFALLVHGEGERPALVLAAVAAGLGLGTKFTLVVPVAALTIGVIATAPPGRRWASARWWLFPLVAAGAFWYARDLVLVGNPVPGLRAGIGPLSFPSPPIGQIDRAGYTVAHYATDGTVWRHWFLPGLRRAFGPAWPFTLSLGALGAGAAVIRGRGPVRVLGLVSVAAAVGYLFTPASAQGLAGRPGNFFVNLRWLAPALVTGLLALALSPPFAGRRRHTLVLGTLVLAGLVSQLQRDTWDGYRGRAAAIGVAVLLVAGAWRVGTRAMRRVTPAVAAVAILGVVFAAGWPVQRYYFGHRYTRTELLWGPSYAWARGVKGQRIAIAGFYQQYPLYGLDLSNHVQYVGRRGPYGTLLPIPDCLTWRRAVRDGHYRFAVTGPAPALYGNPPIRAREEAWARSDPGATELVHKGLVSVFRIDGPARADGCPHAG